MTDELTPEVLNALHLLRTSGFAVCAFTPSELRGAPTRHVEDRLIEMGWDVIDVLATEPRRDEEDA